MSVLCFDEIVLSHAAWELLKKLDQCAVSCSAENESAFRELHDVGFLVGAPSVGADYCRISRQGRAFLQYAEAKRAAKRRDTVRYCITTTIAVAALIVAAISLAAQLGLIQLPAA